jgi:transposase-like protein
MLDWKIKKGVKMPKKANTPEQIINKLKEAEIMLSHGITIALICKKIGVTDRTYYRWRKEYGGMRVDQARRLKELEQENTQLKKVVADFALDNAILEEAARGNF